ncbi:hypothetical protein ACNJYD_08160 [Bradyrhizobium sp. DASA03005]|uniref:hypothetical protein n=1 Tax=Bradyrhizobium sp. SPXBL-02 TaxID=3395912 RepID=UPI003F72E89B
MEAAAFGRAAKEDERPWVAGRVFADQSDDLDDIYALDDPGAYSLRAAIGRPLTPDARVLALRMINRLPRNEDKRQPKQFDVKRAQGAVIP